MRLASEYCVALHRIGDSSAVVLATHMGCINITLTGKHHLFSTYLAQPITMVNDQLPNGMVAPIVYLCFRFQWHVERILIFLGNFAAISTMVHGAMANTGQ